MMVVMTIINTCRFIDYLALEEAVPRLTSAIRHLMFHHHHHHQQRSSASHSLDISIGLCLNKIMMMSTVISHHTDLEDGRRASTAHHTAVHPEHIVRVLPRQHVGEVASIGEAKGVLPHLTLSQRRAPHQ